VASGAILLGRRQGLLLAVVALLLFSSLVAFTYVDVLPINITHHHLSLLHDERLHELIDPDLVGAKGADFIGSHILVLTIVLFGSAYGFGTLRSGSDRGNRNSRASATTCSFSSGSSPTGRSSCARTGPSCSQTRPPTG